MAEAESAELGFCEEAESWNLYSRYLPSKVGGRPAWLDLKEVPGFEKLKCAKCEIVMTFLLQLYAPVDDDDIQPIKESCYHRAIFIFVCRKCSASFKVFRSQLPQKNDFYSLEDPEDKENWCSDVLMENFIKVCSYCGCVSSSVCAKCKKVSYCCREHQVADWNVHKKNCKSENESESKSAVSKNGFLFPEWKIVIEEEKLDTTKKSEKEEVAKLENLKKEGKAGSFADDSSVDAELNAIETDEDKHFMKFKDITESNPDQVVRYAKGKPLWVSDANIPSEENIPKCGNCGNSRQFEFQIMPQLLNFLDIDPLKDDLDFGTLAVYTCKENCDGESPYKEEFLWKQDFVK